MKFLAIGDSCTDKFIYGKCETICSEAPIPVFKIVKEKTNGGMAKNVQANVKALGVDCDVITHPNEIFKTRYVDIKSNQMLLRVDDDDEIEEKFHYKGIEYNKYDAVLISNYGKGFIKCSDVRDICQYHDNVFCCSNNVEWKCDLPLNLKFLKINEKELELNSHLKHHLTPDPTNTSSYTRPDQIIVTCGRKGALYMGKMYPPPQKVVAHDVSGAGDTFLAALAVSMTRVGNAEVAINYANECASEVVQKRGVVTV
jgi:D-beta-D-heptose 7-phosphate kinase/D-beta-D-heptose 1-phosphate adenosyltransferase